MKVTLTVVLVFGYVAVILALPAKKDEVELVPTVNKNYGDQPIIDTGYGFGGPFSNPFEGLFDNLEGIMTRMREQMDSILKRIPLLRGGANSTEELPDFEVAGAFPTFPRFGDVDLGKGNTTSVTKVIDGHKVVINETEYKKEDDFGGAFFKVRIIDVQPESNESTEKNSELIPPATKDVESIENSLENEIPKSSEASNYENLESFEADDVEPIATNNIDDIDGGWDEVDKDVQALPYEYYPTAVPIDLSRDTYVNQILADQAAPINPDAEVFYNVSQDTRQSTNTQNPT